MQEPTLILARGVHIDNTAGVAGVTLTGTNVTNSNWTNGLDVASNGAISINNLTANNNGYFDTLTDIQDDAVNGYGASLDNSSVSTAQPITLTGTNQFNNNMYDGLDVFSNGGAVTLNNLTANGNGLAYDPDPNTNPDSSGYGVLVDNTSSGTVGQNVTISGTNQFNNNWLDGLDVYSYGNLALNNVTANSNGQGTYVDYGFGAFLDNCMFSGTGTCAIVTPTTVTLTGANQFNNNGDDGLRVFSKGAITLNGLTANGNGLAHDPDPNTNPHSSGFGVYVDNTYSGTAVGQNVTLTGTDVFNNNWLDGLDIYSYGIIALNGVTASDNGQGDYDGYGSGAWLDNCNSKDGGITCQTVTPKTVTLTGNNQFSNNNGNDGLDVFSKGAITVNNVNADNNGNYGAFLENDFPGAVGAVSVNNTATYQPDFSSNGGYGLYILSRGTITVMDLNAQSNGADGVYLDNTSNTTGTAAVNLGTARANWSNWLSYNYNSGLEVLSNGLVTLSSLNAENNGHYNSATHNSSGYGVWVNNSTSSLSQGVTLNGTWNGFKNNYLSGLEIYTTGIVTTNQLDADNNGYNTAGETTVYGYGVLIDNCAYNHSTSQCTILTPKTITLNGYNNYNNNYSGGLYVYSNGAITSNTVNSNNNITGSGASFINNANNAAPQSVTLNALNGTSNFYGNGGTGLFVQSFGLVTLNSVNADTNKVDGIHVDNATGALASQLKGVTILGYADVYNNPGTGLYVTSLGPISINNIDAENKNGVGVYINNYLGNPGTGVTFTGNINTSNNIGGGMDVLSRGAITFNNLTGTWIGNNGSYGWNLNNSYAGSVGGITMTIVANQNIGFPSNGGYGLWAQSLGAITTTNLDAWNNGGFGVTLDNAFPGAAATATITMNDPSTTDNNFNGNTGDGLDVLSNRTITLNSISAQNNNGYGAYIDNCGYTGGICASTITPAPGVTLTGNNNFGNNTQSGLWLTSNGAITVSNLSANNNSLGGAELKNYWGTSGVTLTGSNNFIGNSNQLNDGLEDGLDIYSDGAITVNNLMASYNDGIGAHLDNCLWNSGLNKCTGSGSITLTGTNTFSYNYSDGLDASTHGNITLNNVTADNNGGTGVSGYAGGSILVACGSMTNNGGYGWSLAAGTIATLKGVFAFGNNGGFGNTEPANGTFIYQRSCP
jgi:putative surface-exposed virulence protein